jgi:hypothetical protein
MLLGLLIALLLWVAAGTALALLIGRAISVAESKHREDVEARRALRAAHPSRIAQRR